jgi:SNF2-related domain/SNF2 Helicase protein/Helicase conserved C-terminal domain
MSLELVLSPAGQLLVEPADDVEPRLSPSTINRVREAFGASAAHGLELLASAALHEPLPPVLAFWREFARRYFTSVCHRPAVGDPKSTPPTTPPPSEAMLTALADEAPPMRGLEYLNAGVLTGLWLALDSQVQEEIQRTVGGTQSYLHALNPVWNAVGRVTFHLAENKRSPEHPFAFLATYTHRVSGEGKVQHIPLGRALGEYAGAKNRSVLTSLLSPVQRAAETSSLARELLESRALFHPQAWTPVQAYRFLREIPLLEQGGVTVRIPDWWKAGHPPRPQIRVRIGEKAANLLGQDGLLDFNLEKTLDGEPLTEAEWREILSSANGLVLLKGRWVEVDTDQLKEVLAHWKRVEAGTDGEGVSLLQGLRLLSGFNPKAAGDTAAEESRADWGGVVAGEWLQRALAELQSPQISAESDPGPELRAELRPYQRQGVHWLWFMNHLRLGACLADDMGLGKTIQVIALLLVLKRQPPANGQPRTSLLIVPASLIANWKSEIQKFAPSLSVFFAHPSETPAESMTAVAHHPEKTLRGHDLVITSYALLLRSPWLKEREWSLVVLDEAQAIKNPGARQTRAAKEIRARHRIALSGTPIENRLGDLWSLFDFLCPGLLGGAKDFGAFVKGRTDGEQRRFAPLRRLVRPYILRRLKTDKRIISDLPQKTELDAFCQLTRRQAALYQQAVQELAERLDSPMAEGIQRRGVILAFLTRFKQICNHPSQWLGDDAYPPEDSGKFQRLRELCEEIAARQEKVLVFSQYRVIANPLATHLSGVFGRTGLVLHGGTAVSRRQEMVNEFQREGGAPFFVLSLKAGGTGLNLTAASHVIHFDRWWNPAVENQATDRAFRIGQKRSVMVHKFICRGTLEERIHELIASKKSLAEDILGEGGEQLLTEMNNTELLRFVALDIKAASED